MDSVLSFFKDDTIEPFDVDYQNRFLHVFISDRDGYPEQIVDIAQPEYFDAYQKLLLDYELKFFNQYKEVARFSTLKDIVREKERGMNREVLLGLIEKIEVEYDDVTMQRLADAQERFGALGGYEWHAEGDKILEGLGFPTSSLSRPLREFSGGWRMRAMLGKLLLQAPDLLLLDEPTNHLDAESVLWLEQHLAQYSGTVIAVTHDRYFLDNVAGWILELDRGEGIPWKGNYSSWLEQKSNRMAQEEKVASKRRKTLERELDWVRQGSKGRQTKQKARLQNYDKLLNEDQKQLDENLEIYIPNGPRLGTNVIEAKGVAKAFGDKLLYDNLNLEMRICGFPFMICL